MKTEARYNWLADAVRPVRWRKFFSFKPGVDPGQLADVEQRFGPLPKDYIHFIKEFGESRLFRDLRGGSYNLAVFSGPRTLEGRNGEWLLEIGFFINGGYAHLRKRAGSPNWEPGVFEGAGLQVRKAAESFEEWLKKRFGNARKLYRTAEWKRIEEGALPFSTDELRLVEAMGLFAFEQVGTASNGNMQIRVYNGSALRLSCLTVDARAVGRLEGAVFLDVSSIAPGETKIIEHDCYKSLVSADKVELFRKPLPEPEDRGTFHEFADSQGVLTPLDKYRPR